MVVRGVAAESPEDAVVTTEGPGVDVTFEGTELVSDLTVFFDDLSIGSIVPGDALPLVLHRPDGQPWEARALEFTPDGVPYLVTRDFSPNVLSRIQPPRWLTDSIDNAVNWWAGGTQSRGCDGSGPSWAWVQPTSQMVHLCTISNVDRSSGEVRAELQVQSNRQYFEWVSVPAGAEYVWVENQPDIVRQVFGQMTGHDWTREVLLPEGSWMSAGFRQQSDARSMEFKAYSDGWTTAFDVLKAIVGFTPDGQGWAAIAIIAAKCRAVDGAQSTIDFLGCAIKTAGEHLADPDVAFAAAMDVFGERSFAEAYSTKLQSAATVLNFLGKVVKAVGIGMAVRVLLIRLLDWGSESANSRFGTSRSTSMRCRVLSRSLLLSRNLSLPSHPLPPNPSRRLNPRLRPRFRRPRGSSGTATRSRTTGKRQTGPMGRGRPIPMLALYPNHASGWMGHRRVRAADGLLRVPVRERIRLVHVRGRH